MNPIAIQLYTLRKRAKDDLPGVLKDVAEMGYAGVEPAGLGGHDPAEIRKMLEDLGLVACSAYTDLPTSGNIREVVETAEALGYKTIISGAGPDDVRIPEAAKLAGGRFQRAAELLRPYGLRMGYHNHWWELEKVGDRFAIEHLLAAAPDVLWEVDVYWASHFGQVDVPGLIARYRDRVPLLHLKDGPLVKGEPHTAVGAGKMDIPACVSAADPRILEWLIVELDDCATDMTAAARQSCRYLADSGLAKGS